MKVQFNLLRQVILVGVTMWLTIASSYSQIITRVLAPDADIGSYIPWYDPRESIPRVNTPVVDVQAVLLQDSLSGRVMPRIGIKQDIDVSTTDGQIMDKGNYSVWSMTLHSANARSMSVRFDNTYLPSDAIMYIYNEDTRFVVGPIDSDDFREGTFRSDYLNGDYMTLSIFMPSASGDNFKINIDTYDHGVIALNNYDGDFGTSAPCNVNIACEEGNGWECQSESVCKIIHSCIGSCTGSLINNDCCDLTPYILTANHCVCEDEIDDYVFRFNYQSPQCTPNGETTPSQWTCYNGSELRSNWANTDFALLELVQEFEPEKGISFAGWDRQNINPEEVTMIHHPMGDVKKISFDANPVIEPNPINFGSFVLQGGSLRITMNQFNQGDFGVLEGGSSGCGYFNEDGHLISQHTGGQTDDCEDTFDKWSGRISQSWEGNGTNATRLRNWLGASTNPNTMDCMASPYIEGPDILCSSEPKEFSFIRNMPCEKELTWSVDPPNLVSNPIDPGENPSDVVLIANDNVNGRATLTATLSANGCDEVILEHDFWVGVPEQPSYFLLAWYDPYMERITLSVPPVPGATSYNWTVENQTYNNQGSYVKLRYEACPSELYDIRFSVSAVNECGESPRLYGRIERDCGFQPPMLTSPVTVYPNPSNASYVIVARKSEVTENETTGQSILKGELISIDGKTIKKFKLSNNGQYRFDDLNTGVYVLKMYNGNNISSIQKIIVL